MSASQCIQHSRAQSTKTTTRRNLIPLSFIHLFSHPYVCPSIHLVLCLGRVHLPLIAVTHLYMFIQTMFHSSVPQQLKFCQACCVCLICKPHDSTSHKLRSPLLVVVLLLHSNTSSLIWRLLLLRASGRRDQCEWTQSGHGRGGGRPCLS